MAPGTQFSSFLGSGLLSPPHFPGLVNTLQVPGAESSGDEEDLESFCILGEEGSGIVLSWEEIGRRG